MQVEWWLLFGGALLVGLSFAVYHLRHWVDLYDNEEFDHLFKGL